MITVERDQVVCIYIVRERERFTGFKETVDEEDDAEEEKEDSRIKERSVEFFLALTVTERLID